MLIASDISRMHRDVRRGIELGFWSQRREREAKKILRSQNKGRIMRFKGLVK